MGSHSNKSRSNVIKPLPLGNNSGSKILDELYFLDVAFRSTRPNSRAIINLARLSLASLFSRFICNNLAVQEADNFCISDA